MDLKKVQIHMDQISKIIDDIEYIIKFISILDNDKCLSIAAKNVESDWDSFSLSDIGKIELHDEFRKALRDILTNFIDRQEKLVQVIVAQDDK